MSAAVPLTGILTFLRELRGTGTPVVCIQGQGGTENCLALIEKEAAAELDIRDLLKSWHAEVSQDLGGPGLDFDESAARRGATMLFRAAWFYLNRDSDAAEVLRLLQEPPPGPPTAAAQFSADLTLQYLPAVFRMALALAPGDPLLAAIRRMAMQLPLSGVGVVFSEGGIPAPDPAAWAALRSHSGLWQLFLDRTVEARGTHWLRHPEVVEGIRFSLGSYVRELAPALDRASSVVNPVTPI